MKKTVSLLAALFAMHSAMLAATVPATFNYQGKVSDAAGVLVGDGSSVNRKMLFRFYDDPTAGTLLWAEVQTVTIYKGEFSVLLGTGQAYDADGTQQPHPSIDTVFTARETKLYLEITVGDSSTTNALSTATPITPRQTIATTAFAFRAQTADRINSGGDLQIGPDGTSGLGYYSNSSNFNSTSVNGPVLYGLNGGILGSVNASGVQKTALRWNNFGNVGIGGEPNNTADGNYGLSVTGGADQLYLADPGKGSLSVGFHGTGTYGNLQARNSSWSVAALALNVDGGNVGIGTSTPNSKLEVAGAIAASGSDGYVFRWGGDTDGGLFSPADGTVTIKTNALERMRVGASGNVGIGTTAPSAKLDIGGGGVLLNGVDGRNYFKDSEKQDGLGLRVGALWSTYGIYAESGNCAVGGYTGVVLQDKIGINTSGRMSLNGAPQDSLLNIKDGEILFAENGVNSNCFGIKSNVSSDYWHIFGNASSVNNMALYIDTGDDGNEEIIFRQCGSNTQNVRMKINSDGNVVVSNQLYSGSLVQVGSGTSVVKLCTSDQTSGGWLRQDSGSMVLSTNTGDMYFGYSGSSKTLHFMGGGTADRMVLTSEGRLGIGTSTPDAPIHVTSWAYQNYALEGYLNASGAGDYTGRRVDGAVSIHAGDRVITNAEFDVVSDSRIKTDFKVTDSDKDLGTLCAIEVTDYHFKDTIAGGTKPYKKVIAQQVETVYPQAINLGVGVVPDIYKKAAVEDGWVKLATDLKVGEQVSLIDEKEKAVHKVLAVREGAFQVEAMPAGKEVFVYGREVKDFRSVDYDAIAMLNVSATQELAKQLKEKDAKIAALEAKLAAQAKQDSVRDAKLAAIEKKLFGGAGGPETVSLKTGE
ncbi:MAG: tail fiber domain-containing protein [Akkermansiaceae bacterium]|nr:tail fiber domain-containing protein [Akkermansiaceae bacterium]